jgi:hypothetical protein
LARTRHAQIELGAFVGVGVATAPHGTRDAGDAPIVLHPLDATRVGTPAPPLVGATHPVLQQLGPVGQRYVRMVRARRRRYLTRRFAAGVLLAGTLASCAAFATTDARLPVSGIAAASADSAVDNADGATRSTVAPVASRATATSRPVVAATPPVTPPIAARPTERPAFTGAFARNGRRFVAYPANHDHPFLVCTRRHESDTAGGYRAISPRGTFRGAYQFRRSTWNNVARHVRRFDLVGVDPAAASPVDQDWMALFLYRWLGASHWEGRCAGL